MENINSTLIIFFYGSLSSPQLQKICFFIKNTEIPVLQQVTGGNTPNIVLKRMLGHFLKTPQLKKMLGLQDRKKDYENSAKKKISNQKLNQ